MENVLNVAIIQTDIIWENSIQNRLNFKEKIDAISKEVDLIVLQEMFTTGFTNNVENFAETMQGETVKWMLENASDKEAILLGSLIIKDGGKYYNRLIVAFPDGNLKYYNKRHLFSYAGEDKVFTSGNSRLVFTYKGFNICPLVCYDLRFPVWSRNTKDIDVLIYIANWPKPRINAWDILLKGRAIENMCYTVGVNRLGTDFNNLEYLGHSTVIDAMGNNILDFEEGEETTKIILLRKDHLENIRSKFGFLADRDEFEIV